MRQQQPLYEPSIFIGHFRRNPQILMCTEAIVKTHRSILLPATVVVIWRHVSALRTALLLSMICVPMIPGHTPAAAESYKINKDAEQWARNLLQNGYLADLEKGFPSKNDRVISAGFVRDVICSSKPASLPNGVQIARATIIGALDLSNADIQQEVRLVSCTFSGDLLLGQATFGRNIDLRSSTFTAIVFMHSTNVARSAIFDDSVFLGRCDFSNSSVGDNFQFTRARFLLSGTKVSFMSISVGGDMYLKEALFLSEVEFGGATIKGRLFSDEVQFLAPHGEADFSQVKVLDGITFRAAIFSGPVIFNYAEISSVFDATSATFTNKERGVSFVGTHFDKIASFEGARFFGPARFTGMVVTGSLQAENALFQDQHEEVNFNSIKVGEGLVLTKSTFQGSADFSGAEIGGQMNMTRTAFTSESAIVRFPHVSVGNGVLIKEAQINSGIDMSHSTISGGIEISGGSIGTYSNNIVFNNMRVDGGFVLYNTVIKAPVSLNWTDISGPFLSLSCDYRGMCNLTLMHIKGQATLQDNRFARQLIMTEGNSDVLTIDGTSGTCVLLDIRDYAVERRLQVSDSTFTVILADHLSVSGPAVFDKVRCQRVWNMEYCRFTSLFLCDVEWPQEKDQLRLAGTSFRHISAGESLDSWTSLLRMANISKYSPSVYKSLGSFFREDGYPERADSIYMDWKTRETNMLRQEGQWQQYLWNEFLHISVGYGRSPERALIWSVLFITIGCIIIEIARSKSVLVREKKNSFLRNTSRSFWTSMDLFIPVIELPFSDKVQVEKWGIWANLVLVYILIHRIAGLLLIPVGLVAWTGMIQ